MDGANAFDVAVFIADKAQHGYAVAARVFTIQSGGFLLAIVDAENARPFRPGIVGRPCVRRPGHDFKLNQALAAVTQGGADAISAGVATADDDDVLAFGGDEVPVAMAV